LYRTSLVLGCLLLLASAGCRAQNTAANLALDRKIEVLIRSELSVPPTYDISIGAPLKSDIAGFDTIAVTFSLAGHPDHSQTLEYLISKDGNTLARLSKWDITKDPGSQISTYGRAVRGNPDAKVTLVNFDDLQCPYCARMHTTLFPETLDHYKGMVKVVYMDFPLTEIHPWAMHAAVNANCLAAQSPTAYWNFVDYMHSHGEDVSGPDHDPAKSAAMLDKIARQQGAVDKVDSAKLDACIVKQDDTAIRAEMKLGDKLGVSATPTVFVNGDRWPGVLSGPELRLMIDRALRAQGITPPPNDMNIAPKPASEQSSTAEKP
jgi:protein-disulfide isomerase